MSLKNIKQDKDLFILKIFILENEYKLDILASSILEKQF
jgi:hypothetical protein